MVRRALTFVDEVVIGIGVNENKRWHFDTERRLETIRSYYKDNPRVQVMAYDCLTIDFAKQVGANLIIRGIRTVKKRPLPASTVSSLALKLSCSSPNQN